jgi:hypothetical protein
MPKPKKVNLKQVLKVIDAIDKTVKVLQYALTEFAPPRQKRRVKKAKKTGIRRMGGKHNAARTAVDGDGSRRVRDN